MHCRIATPLLPSSFTAVNADSSALPGLEAYGLDAGVHAPPTGLGKDVIGRVFISLKSMG